MRGRLPGVRSGLALGAVAALLTACAATGSGPGAASAGSASGPSVAPGPSATPTPGPEQPLPWGPTVGDLAQARAEVADWAPERLAGQVIVGRYHGTAPEQAADLVRRLHLAGLCLTGANIADADQVRATNRAVAQAVTADGRDLPPVLGVDQEGGTTAHLRDLATGLPAFMAAGAAVAGAQARGEVEAGEQVVQDLARATALELRELGFTWVFAPDADVTIGPEDPTIGTRSPAGDPQLAALATAAAVRGFTAGGIVSTPKHYPGHGSVTADSHKALPVQDASLAALADRDLKPFDAAVTAGAPAVMMSHIAVTALDPGVPISLSPAGYTALRGTTRFEGVAITDSLGMGAVRRGGDPGVRALAAGADLLLMPADTAATHAAVVDALAGGTLPRPRVEEAAARVVALQRWQASRAGAVPVPDGAAGQARRASAALSAAALTRLGGPCRPEPLRSVRVVSGRAGDRAAFAAAARRAGLRLGSGPSVALVGSTAGVSADVVAAVDWPTRAAGSGPARRYALYGASAGSFDALVAVLQGRAQPQGELPVPATGGTPSGC